MEIKTMFNPQARGGCTIFTRAFMPAFMPALITVVWCAMVLLVNPVGDFPLNDDWAYGWSVKTLLATGEYQLSDWTATNLLPQVMWGALFCLPFGFSFTALRLSTLGLGLLGVLLTYGLLRQVGATTGLALLGALVVALNPIYFGSANSFNSDVPSMAIAMLSLYFIVLGLKPHAKYFTGIGIGIALLAILNRQSSIVVLLALGCVIWVKQGGKIQAVVPASIPALLGLLLQVDYSHWLSATGKTPILYGFQITNLLATFSQGLPQVIATYGTNAVIMAVYLGCFLLPFLVIGGGGRFTEMSASGKRLGWAMGWVVVAIATIQVRHGQQLPLVGNILEPFGLGPHSFEGYGVILSGRTQAIIDKSWQILTVLGAVGGAWLLFYLVLALLEIMQTQKVIVPTQASVPAHRSSRSRRDYLVLTIASALIYFGLIGGLDQQYWFDRYLIFFLPMLLLLVALLRPQGVRTPLPRPIVVFAVTLLLIYGGFTISATHDYLAWNRVRWQALNTLMTTAQIPPAQIDGGFEFNGWYFGNRLSQCNPQYQRPAAAAIAGWESFDCLWGKEPDRYRYTLGFQERPGYTIAQRYSFRRWLPWRIQSIYVLQKWMNNQPLVIGR